MSICREDLPSPISLAQKYDNSFHFYLAKGINQLLRKKSYSPDVIRFHDLQFLDQQYEFLKRYYRKEEVPGRIELLANYFIKCRILPEQMPCLVSQGARKYIFKRIKRYGKFKKRVEEMEKDWDDEFAELYEEYLYSVKTSQLNESLEVEEKQQISYDSIPYDIFENHDQEPLKTIRMDKKIFSIEHTEEDQDIFIQEPAHLILDFGQPKKKTPPTMYLDLKRLNYNVEPDLSSKESLTKKNISSLSPELRYSGDQLGFYTGREGQEHKSPKIKQLIQKKNMYIEPYPVSEKQYRQGSKHDFKIKKTKEYGEAVIPNIQQSSNKQHEEYIKLLQKIRKKYRSPELSKKSPNLGKKQRLKSKEEYIYQQALPSNPSRIETLRFKAMKLIEDVRGMREVKSSEPTVRNK